MGSIYLYEHVCKTLIEFLVHSNLCFALFLLLLLLFFGRLDLSVTVCVGWYMKRREREKKVVLPEGV